MPKPPQNDNNPGYEPHFRYKQCLILRNDVKMSCGKKCAQAAHASIGAFESADKTLRKSWQAEGQKKVVLKADSERTLFEIKVIAERAGISTSLVQDAGTDRDPARHYHRARPRTGKSEDLDKITGTLSLL